MIWDMIESGGSGTVMRELKTLLRLGQRNARLAPPNWAMNTTNDEIRPPRKKSRREMTLLVLGSERFTEAFAGMTPGVGSTGLAARLERGEGPRQEDHE